MSQCMIECSFMEAKSYVVNQHPEWYADSRCFYKSGVPDAFDEIAVKDPSIVHTGGTYHLFYTGVTNRGWWQTGYATASTLGGLKDAPHIFLHTLKENYFCAPQVFYFEPHKKWYLIYQDGDYGAAYATTKTIDDPDSWKGPVTLGIPRPNGYDFWVICDDRYAYVFYTPDGNTRTLIWRRTPLKHFPAGWGPPAIAISGPFEGVSVYKCRADGMYYLLPENFEDPRYYELWTAASPEGPWRKIAEKWISRRNIVNAGEPWTTNVSHGEIIRAGINQKLEINDIKNKNQIYIHLRRWPAFTYRTLE
jgi:hypothetical protein